jgi:hypothetical protein
MDGRFTLALIGKVEAEIARGATRGRGRSVFDKDVGRESLTTVAEAVLIHGGIECHFGTFVLVGENALSLDLRCSAESGAAVATIARG